MPTKIRDEKSGSFILAYGRLKFEREKEKKTVDMIVIFLNITWSRLTINEKIMHSYYPSETVEF
jgi:hypothetical protein